MRRLKLTVGINDYPGTGADLRGCVNDALAWSELLARAGYVGPILTDANATRPRFLAEVRGLLAQARFGDRVVITYSGHGTNVPDLDGDEADGRDEALVMHDWQAGGLVTDDELHRVLQERRWGVRVLVVSDSCNSGTMQRAFGEALRPVDHLVERAPRFLPPEVLGIAPAPRGPRATSRPRPTAALLSGCDDPEYSYDAHIDGRFQGAFTAAAIRTWEPGLTLAAWRARIVPLELPSRSYPQTPQLAATRSQRRWTL